MSDASQAQIEPGTEGFDLDRWLVLLRRRWWLILLCAITVAFAAAGFSLTQPKHYTAKASLLFRESEIGSNLLGIGVSGGNVDPVREAETNVKLVQSSTVAARTAAALQGALGPGDVASRISVSAEGQSDVVSVAATDPDPAFAAKVANTYVRSFIEVRRDADRDEILQQRDSLQRQLSALTPDARNSPAGRSLAARIEQLSVLASVQTGNAQVFQWATVPSAPSSRAPKRNLVLGGVLGLLLGLGLALLLERLNHRVREPEELAATYDLPVLAEIPDSKSFSAHVPAAGLNGDSEAFRMLRARLQYFNADRKISSVAVTSCFSQEGKSTVAWHLAGAVAMQSDRRVLLIDADLRRPSIASQHALFPTPGLTEVLVEQCDLAEAIQQVAIAEGTREYPGRSMDVLVSGTLPPNPAELLESRSMGVLLRQVAKRYDFVVIDCSPTLVVSDPVPLLTQVAGVVIVSRIGSTTRDASIRLRDQLRNLQAPVLGVVANCTQRSSHSYYGYTDNRPIRLPAWDDVMEEMRGSVPAPAATSGPAAGTSKPSDPPHDQPRSRHEG
jgi:succinoglycan biosynthesis transport protein ExoP